MSEGFSGSQRLKSPNLSESLKVCVLAGGVGSERQISLQSGRCVAEAIRQVIPEVVISDITPGNTDIFDDDSIDVFFIPDYADTNAASFSDRL